MLLVGLWAGFSAAKPEHRYLPRASVVMYMGSLYGLWMWGFFGGGGRKGMAWAV